RVAGRQARQRVGAGEGDGARVGGDRAAAGGLGGHRDREARPGGGGAGRGRHAELGGAGRGSADQVGDQFVGDGSAQPGHEVVAGPGRVGAVAAAGSAAAGDVVEVAGELVQVRQGLGGAVEGAQALQGAALVGDGDERGPLGGGGGG